MDIQKIIKEKIINNDRLYVIARCLKGMGNLEFVNLLKGYFEGSYDYVTIVAEHVKQNNGNAKAIYLIELCKTDDKHTKIRSDSGLCANLRDSLERLYFADIFGYIPIVYWGKRSNYYDPGMDSKTKNVFEYYFEPVSETSYESVYNCEILIKSIQSHRNFSMAHANNNDSYFVEQDEIAKLAYVYNKYLHLNKDTKEILLKNMSEIMHDAERILGVHFRGTDYNLGLKNHPRAVTIEECLAKTKELRRIGYDKVFLATDDANAMEAFKNEFKSDLLYYSDTFRSKDKMGVHDTNVDRPLHHYRLGLEVIRDIYTLASCDSLICGLSQVSFAARYVNLALGNSYKHSIVLDKGINNYSKRQI